MALTIVKMKLFFVFAVLILSTFSDAQNLTCSDGEVLCAGTVDECIKTEYVCDGTFIDCSNDADEINCPCDFGEFACPNSTVCVHNDWICDHIPDCPGGEDEDQNCPPCEGFTCSSGACIPIAYLCDGHADCLGGEDETEDCPQCTEFDFICDNGACVPEAYVCDGVQDCTQAEDEPDDCYFQCSDGSSIPNKWRCDGFADCSNDEDGCPCDDKFLCEDGKLCIPGSWICDGDLDCNDGSDEANCRLSAAQPASFKRRPLVRSKMRDARSQGFHGLSLLAEVPNKKIRH